MKLYGDEVGGRENKGYIKIIPEKKQQQKKESTNADSRIRTTVSVVSLVPCVVSCLWKVFTLARHSGVSVTSARIVMLVRSSR